MRILTLFVAVMTLAATQAPQAQAQRRQKQTTQTPDGQRRLPVVVMDSWGHPLRSVEVFATIRGAGGLVRFDRLGGDAALRVAETDTVGLMVGEMYFEFASAAFDTLFVSVRPPEIEGMSDSMKLLEPVVVTARRPRLIEAPMGDFDADTYTGSSYRVPMRRGARDLKAALDGQVGGLSFKGEELYIRSGSALVIVDGFPMRDFADANARVMMDDVRSITVHKDAGMAAFYSGRTGGNIGGVLVITTNRGFNQKRKTKK